MWQRSELKQRAKLTLGRSYWRSVLAALVLFLCVGGGASASVSVSANAYTQFSMGQDYSYAYSYGYGIGYGMTEEELAVLMVLLGVFAVVMLVVWGLALVFQFFVAGPVEVGCERFFIVNREGEARMGELGAAFRAGCYLNVVKTQLLRYIFTFLWSLLLVVPGIVKSYEYRMIPYILAENPQMEYREAFRLSREMMNGEKWNAFVLDLSFIGWNIFGVLTCGIVNVFYVDPYRANTNAELYAVLKAQLFGGRPQGDAEGAAPEEN